MKRAAKVGSYRRSRNAIGGLLQEFVGVRQRLCEDFQLIVEWLSALVSFARRQLLIDVLDEVLEQIGLRFDVELAKVRQAQLQKHVGVREDREAEVREDLGQPVDLLLHEQHGFLLVKLLAEEVPFERASNKIRPFFVQHVHMREVLERAARLNRCLLLLLVLERDGAPEWLVDLQFAQFLKVALIAVGEEIVEVFQNDRDVVFGEIVGDLRVLVRFEQELEDDVRIGFVHVFHELWIDVRIVETGENRFEFLVAEQLREEPRRIGHGTAGVRRRFVGRRWCRRRRTCGDRRHLAYFDTSFDTNTAIDGRMYIVFVLR